MKKDGRKPPPQIAVLIALVGFVGSIHGAEGPRLTVASPADYQVFQRARALEGKVAFEVLLSGAPGGAAIEVRLRATSRQGKPDDAWQPATREEDERYRAALAAPAGGWYRAEVRATDNGHVIAHAAIDHVGIGEVFIVGGQSNSTNYGAVRQKTATGLVTCFDGNQWALAADPLRGVDGKGGSIWPLFGDALAEKYKVPVGIVPVGAGGTSARHWLPAGQRVQIVPTNGRMKQVGEHEWESDGKLFDRMVARMKTLGPGGFRAVLWHQGESDANQADPTHTLPGNLYHQYLRLIITRARHEAGWEIPWFVAQASYHSPTDPASADIRAAQKALWDDKTALEGPDTDALTGDNRNGVHMSDKGLHAHAALWAQKVSAWLDKVLAIQ